ncbi:MAG: radical SAM family heme chaperone HemW [Clostridiales bacterium]|nr:radical SAM family heme chaperone HemW [Eubacteriales bacterium]MDH7565499.1 radical SAM family heme chaperone HemW [Clostridiales bacterium]
MQSTLRKSVGLYIHIPFCKSKCYYCDFNSYAGMESYASDYFKALKNEIFIYSDKLKGDTVKSIFIGGGTPSLVDGRYIYEIINHCRQNLDIDRHAEISIETNPGTLSLEKLTTYAAAGINRLSMGLQAWQDSLLKTLGRIHRREEFVENFNIARRVGFKNINIDVIFGIPGQRLEEWDETITQIVRLDPEHVSCYSLKIEEDTVFGEKLASGSLVPVDDELDREMYYLAKDCLSRNKFNHYEISNFAKPGFECRHNLIYWKDESYIGVGAGAHSFFEGKRYNNTCGVESYIRQISRGNMPVENVHRIERNEEMSEFVILGLRLIGGIAANEFKLRFGTDIFSLYGKQLHQLSGRGLIQWDGERIRLTNLGLDVANQVFVEFI